MSHSVVVGKQYLVFKDGCEVTGVVDRAQIRRTEEPVESTGKTISFEFVIGAYEIDDSFYLVLATEVESVSDLLKIFKVKKVEVVQVSLTGGESSVKYLRDSFKIAPLYCSGECDLSLNTQQRAKGLQSREQFIWNSNALSAWDEIYGHDNMARATITGYVGCHSERDFTFLLISRRSNKRAGTRFWMRGADENGDVANFVETEQIFARDGAIKSYVQIRGSIPVSWSQQPDLSRLPPISINHEESETMFDKHINKLTQEYGTVTAVCLTNQKGKEGPITELYTSLSQGRDKLEFHYFDFHHECRKMHYENIDKLLNELQSGDSNGLYGFYASGTDLKQTGVVRTNCVDCLDRTNVVQSKIAFRSLQDQLDGLEIGDYQFFNNIWTENADALSLQYAGTPAMKTDYTRTGKRTVAGALQDGKNALARYYVNTCCDGTRQDEYDLVTTAKLPKQPTYDGLLKVLFMILYFLASLLISFIKGGRKSVRSTRKDQGRKLVNTPLRFKELKN